MPLLLNHRTHPDESHRLSRRAAPQRPRSGRSGQPTRRLDRDSAGPLEYDDETRLHT